MTRKLLLATAATTLLLAAAGATIAMDPSAREAALRDLGFAASECRDSTHGDDHVLVCVHDADAANDSKHADADGGSHGDRDVDDHHSSFVTTDDVVKGRHVSFRVGASNDSIADFTSIGPWANGVVFSSITFSNGAGATRDARGDSFTLSSDDWTWRAFDQADAHWQVHAKENTSVTLVLGPHDNATVEKNGTLVEIERGGHVATLRVGGAGASASLSGDTITLTLPKGTEAAFHIGGPLKASHEDRDDERSEHAATPPKPAEPRKDAGHEGDDK